MTLRSSGAALAAVLCLGLGCSSTPSPGNAPTPTVAISAPPPAPSATESAAADTTTDTDAEPPEEDCDSKIAQAKAADHATPDDCVEMQQQLYALHEQCDSNGMDNAALAILEASECMDDVLSAHLNKVSATLPAAAKDKLAAAKDKLQSAISGFCTRDCGYNWGAHCTMGVLSCVESAMESAEGGTLGFDGAEKIGKATHVFDDQAAALCALPKSVWKDGKVPAGCVNKALTMFQQCGDVTHSCPNP